jgi:hypothetical protein
MNALEKLPIAISKYAPTWLLANPCAGAWVKKHGAKAKPVYLPFEQVNHTTIGYKISEPGIYRYNNTRHGSGYLFVHDDGHISQLTPAEVAKMEE